MLFRWFKKIDKAVVFVLLSSLMILNYAAVQADAQAFNELLDQLRDENVIPRARGSIMDFGNFDDEYPIMNSYQWFPLTEADNFVFSAEVAWSSAFPSPNSHISGCGVVFWGNSDSNDHMLASARMDGHVYFSGNRNQTTLKYIDYFFRYPTIEGKVALTLVVNGEYVTAYADGVRLGTTTALIHPGNELGLATLSGTNYGFGTRCEWKDIYIYTWRE